MLLSARMTAVALCMGLALVSVPSPSATELKADDSFKTDKDLVAHWNLSTPHKNRISNEAGGGLHGTCYGARPVGGALEFDGVDDYVHIRPNWKLASLSAGAISVWFKFYSIPYGEQNIHPILYFGDADGGSDQSSLIIEIGHFWDDRKATALYFTIYGLRGQKPTFCFDSNFDLDLDTWYHFVAVVGEDFNTGYLNGVELVNRNYNFGGPNDSVFFENVVDPGTCLIGKGWFSTFPNACYFDGMIDDIRVYREPLNGEQVRRLYEEDREDLAANAQDVRSESITDESVGQSAPSLQILANPFNPATRIRFFVPWRAHATLRIFNAAGRLITTLLNREVESGMMELEWDARDAIGHMMGSGVYCCALDVGGQTSTKKMILGK